MPLKSCKCGAPRYECNNSACNGCPVSSSNMTISMRSSGRKPGVSFTDVSQEVISSSALKVLSWGSSARSFLASFTSDIGWSGFPSNMPGKVNMANSAFKSVDGWTIHHDPSEHLELAAYSIQQSNISRCSPPRISIISEHLVYLRRI